MKGNDKAESIPNQWMNLPTDSSMNRFCEDYYRQIKPRTKPAAGTVREALISLEENNKDSSLSIYASIFAKRERNERGKSTTIPRAVFWEVQDLMKIILYTYQMDKAPRGEGHAALVFDELADALKQGGFDDLQEDYIKLKMLNSAGIQEKLINELEDNLQKRWNLLKKLAISDKLLQTTRNLRVVLEQLDGIIAELRDSKSVENDISYKINNSQNPQTAAVLELYSELVSERKKLLPQSEKSLPSDEYRWTVSNENKKLVETMQKMLKTHKRRESDCSSDEFLEIYNRYLCMQVPEETKARAHCFAKGYTQILSYINGRCDEVLFKKAIRDELNQFARDIFEDLERLDAYGYSYCRFDPPKAIDAHFRTRLADIHRDIQMVIHEPLMRLRIAYTVFYFLLYPGKENGNCCNLTPAGVAGMEKITIRMRDLIKSISDRVKGVLHLEPSNLRQYAELYNRHVVPIVGCTEINREDLKELVYHLNCMHQINMIDRWKAATKLLTYQCQMAVAFMVEQNVEKLTSEYTDFCAMVSGESAHF